MRIRILMLTMLLSVFAFCAFVAGQISGDEIPEFQIINSSYGNSYAITNEHFEAYFSGSDNTVKFIGPDNDSVVFEAKRSYVRSDAEKTNIVDVSKNQKLLKSSKSLSFLDSYLPNTEVIYSPLEQGIKFNLIIPTLSSLPQPVKQSSNATLNIDFELKVPNNLDIAVNRDYWDKISEVETSGDIVFYREGIPRFYFPASYGQDASGNISSFIYGLRKDNSGTYLTLRMDYQWLADAAYPVVIDPSAVSGCIETSDLVNCSYGTYSGHWIDTTKNILVEKATIGSNSYSGLSGQLKLNSTNGSITIKDSTLDASGSNGALTQSGGSGACLFYGNEQDNIVFRNSTLNCYGGNGGNHNGGANAGNGGVGSFQIFTAKNFDINSSLINAYGGSGGNGLLPHSRGGVGGSGTVFINVTYNIAIRENNQINYNNGDSGADCCGNPAYCISTGYGKYYASQGHIAIGNGTWLRSDGGCGFTQNYYQTDKLTFAETANITVKPTTMWNYLSVDYYSFNNISILSGSDNKLGLFNTNMPQEHKVYCSGTLTVGRAGRTDQKVNFTGCISQQNITKSTYGEVDWLYGDGTGLVPPAISNIICTSCNSPGNQSPYATSDTTPTFTFNTNLNAWCRIADESWNYSTLNSSRDCESGDNTMSHTCTLKTEDELVFQTDYVSISCRELYNKENTSTLQMSMQGLESTTDAAIANGIMSSAIWREATIYSDLVVYLSNRNKNDIVGTFDKVAAYKSKRFAFNYVSENETSVGAFYNLTPSFFFIEMQNMSGYDITARVSSFINNTIS